ncbi:MAG: ATP/GTP-binding protein [Pyrodictiaceae archaeon]
MGKLIVVFVGPAGSGKSTLVAAYAKWLREGGAPVYTVSLDPAAEELPYEPDLDVRSIVDAREVARRYGLGPNGALVKSMEIMAERIEDILGPVKNSDADYVLVDTPGQMEVFLFRDIAWRLAEALREISPESYAVFVLDATVIKDPADYAFLSVLATAVQLRLGLVTAPVLNKIDAVPGGKMLGDITRDFGRVAKYLRTARSLYTEMLREVLKILLKYNKTVAVPRVSAIRGEGLEELHRLVLEMGCGCGDLS